MRRLRFFRLLLPVTLALFFVLIVLALRNPPAPHTQVESTVDNGVRQQLIEVNIIEMEGDRLRMDFDAERIAEEDDGHIQLEGIKQLKIERPDRGPVIVRADFCLAASAW